MAKFVSVLKGHTRHPQRMNLGLPYPYLIHSFLRYSSLISRRRLAVCPQRLRDLYAATRRTPPASYRALHTRRLQSGTCPSAVPIGDVLPFEKEQLKTPATISRARLQVSTTPATVEEKKPPPRNTEFSLETISARRHRERR